MAAAVVVPPVGRPAASASLGPKSECQRDRAPISGARKPYCSAIVLAEDSLAICDSVQFFALLMDALRSRSVGRNH